ncbi:MULTISPECIES: ester cyclase [unclassified Streptomyces]|uniref:ester cyclase n=1 Tax=Streptomyces sp. NPDC004528 TaxID=3154550 RepID=UPI0033BE6B82
MRPHTREVCAPEIPDLRERVMSRSSNFAVLENFGSAVNSDHLGELDEYVAPASVDHDPAPGQAPGPEGYEEMFATMRRAFPDLHIEVEHVMATDDEIAFAYTITGTHLGELMGYGPTGRTVSYRGMQISRFADGKMVERWGSSDELGMLRQLGLIP